MEILIQLISEEEEEIYLYRLGNFTRLNGYFVYYERNETMQNYMQSHASKLSPDDKESELYQFQESFSDDSEIKEKQDVTEQFRNILRERQETLHQKKIMTYLYLTSTFLVIIVFVIKITMMNNYDKMQDMEATL